jgi:hypothetical protein
LVRRLDGDQRQSGWRPEAVWTLREEKILARIVQIGIYIILLACGALAGPSGGL